METPDNLDRAMKIILNLDELGESAQKMEIIEKSNHICGILAKYIRPELMRVQSEVCQLHIKQNILFYYWSGDYISCL